MQIHDRIYVVASGAHGFDLSHPADCHVYLIDGGSEWALVDAGGGVERGALPAALRARGFPVDRIRHAFITHAHADHAGGSAELQDAFGLEIYASPEVAEILLMGNEIAAGVDVGKQQGTYPRDYRYHSVNTAHGISSGETTTVGDVQIASIATAGHSVGHLAFLIDSFGRRDLFTGDALFTDGRIILQNTWDCNLSSQLQSLRHLSEYDFDGLFPGHSMFSLRHGRRHLDAALRVMDSGGIPPMFL